MIPVRALAALFFLAISPACDDLSQPGECGDRALAVSIAGETYCVFRGAISETGFLCPPEAAYAQVIGEYTICAPEPAPIPEVLALVAELADAVQFGGEPAPPTGEPMPPTGGSDGGPGGEVDAGAGADSGPDSVQVGPDEAPEPEASVSEAQNPPPEQATGPAPTSPEPQPSGCGAGGTRPTELFGLALVLAWVARRARRLGGSSFRRADRPAARVQPVTAAP
jgi:hypothetical protein